MDRIQAVDEGLGLGGLNSYSPSGSTGWPLNVILPSTRSCPAQFGMPHRHSPGLNGLSPGTSFAESIEAPFLGGYPQKGLVTMVLANQVPEATRDGFSGSKEHSRSEKRRCSTRISQLEGN